MTGLLGLGTLTLLAVALALAGVDNLPPEISQEHNAGKRSELAIDFADKLIDQARTYYESGAAERGDDELELAGALADECYKAARKAHKAKYWKKAEQKVSALSRRVQALMEDLDFSRRDKAKDLVEHLDSIHDKLLAGVMGK